MNLLKARRKPVKERLKVGYERRNPE